MREMKKSSEMFDQLSPDQRRYMGKVQLMKSLADEMHFPWDDVGRLFDKATVEWGQLNLEQIVDHMCDELRRNHVEHSGKKLKVDGLFLQPEEDFDA
jgi:hypothetical protein